MITETVITLQINFSTFQQIFFAKLEPRTVLPYGGKREFLDPLGLSTLATIVADYASVDRA